ncbi:MAG: SUMF1/EgtB/PvdO family nonheme iron enzyme, partial [Armatimonadetes bacterium]|nr:SUMF1/EgtB/PvdO family nonheme iron enzyme [Armatimonadota bacterium]
LPVVNVRLEDAAAYAAWVGRALPTEAQWERAARGGVEGARYPWGNEDPNPQRACFSLDPMVPGQPRAIGQGQPNGLGLLDMAGNVAEWCRDRYQEGWYGKMPAADPVQEKTEEVRMIQVPAMGSDGVPTTVKASAPLRYAIVRGGSWASGATELRVADRQRQLLGSWDETIGFRLVSPAN